MKQLLALTAGIELGAGLVLMTIPSAAVALLFGSPLDTVAAVTLGRMTGTALLALGLACWLARGDTRSRAAKGLVAGILVYNAGVVILFTFAGLGLRLHGVLLWPAVILHTAMMAWCLVSLGNTRLSPGQEAQP